ncbi:MAG: murein biosynthesis integral membrane protein MurJ [Verrucomicrobiota bacterium]|nr:murein biosynthesis integral membrane protein MurJ [Verrucomicrobiota bacterium]
MATVSGFTALSRILGFIRDILMGYFLGSSHAADAFFAAFKFPNIFRRIFGEGAFNSAFVPLFSRELTSKGRKEAMHFASQTFSILAIVLLIITIIAIPLMSWITMVHAPGFSAVKTFRGDSNNNEVSFDIKIKGSKAIYFVIENGGNAEIKNITLVKNNNDTENPLDQSDWLSEKGKLIKKYALSKDKNFTRIKGNALIKNSKEGNTHLSIYRNHPDTFNLTVTLSKITFIYLLCMALVAHMSGVLNTIKIFGMPAAAPVLLNMTFLAGFLIFSIFWGLKGDPVKYAHVAAWCVFVAGFLQLGALYFTCFRKGLRIKLCKPKISPQIKRLFILMGPGVLAAGIQQINLLVGSIIASFREGAISYLYYSERVYQLPLGVIGIGLGVILLPEVTKRLRNGDQIGAITSMNRGIELAMLLTIPASIALIVIPYPIISTLFQHGAFTAEDANLTALSLAGFAIGIPGYVLVRVLQPGYFARENTKTPMLIAGVTVIVNIVFSIILFDSLGHIGIAIATSIAAWVNVALLLFGLRNFWKPDARLKSRMPKIFIASIVMGSLLWILHQTIKEMFNHDFWLRLGGVSMLVIFGITIYFFIAFKLKASSLKELKADFKKS